MNDMKRRLAREITVQSLYQMEMNEVKAEEAVEMLLEEAAADNESEVEVRNEAQLKTYVLDVVAGVSSNREAIDGLLVDYLQNWQVSRLSRVDRQILRLAVYEMIFTEDVPAKVAVNEAIELSKHFGTEESGKFVNGVLGKMIQDLDKLKGSK
ncbi:N utilization substance protein B [Paenibacillus hunanensis]|nr:N utilization substance protein B [Paenibacillus hunanensis]